MSNEIKIVDGPIMQAVSALKGSVETFESTFPGELKGENRMELLEQVNHLNRTYASLIKTYQALMLKHVETTESSIQTFKETDSSLANTLSFLK